jgi:N-acetylglucosaminyl-diphospho-decaprenol L-rhamnosyltransferase
VNSVGVVIVDYHAGEELRRCIDSLRAEGVREIVVVENGAAGSARPFVDEETIVVEPGVNLGYGRGVNRGAAMITSDVLVVSNPDIEVHEGAISALVAALDQHPSVGIVGPTIVTPTGETYPAHRVFPNPLLAGVHAVLAPLWPNNPATRRYRAPRKDGSVDWVSGAFFAMRASLFREIGGFDESYFMFAEDMHICWKVNQSGRRVTVVPSAVVTHVEGVSRARAPREMIVAHHRSALRFESHTATGARRLLFPLAALVLGLRLAVMLARPGKRR